MTAPIRLRSRTFILVYPNVDSLNLLYEHLRVTLGIESDENWTYLLKIEQLVNEQKNVIGYIELSFSLDIYSSKLTYKNV